MSWKKRSSRLVTGGRGRGQWCRHCLPMSTSTTLLTSGLHAGATGAMIILRYADDIVVGFEKEAEARRFWDEMRLRLREFSLSLHPEKTRLIEFGRFAVVT